MEKTEIWNLVSMAIQGLSPVFLAVLSWVGVMAAKWIQTKVKNEQFSGIIRRLNDAAITVVRDLNQTVVEDLKEASSDGKLTAEERLRIKTEALKSLKSYLGVKGLKMLSSILGLTPGEEIDLFLTSKIESKVNEEAQ